jgi:hypothetical protein
VVLGAGLDTFAYRQPPWGSALKIYEVDHATTQQWKRERLEAADIRIPDNLRFVSVDFERSSIPEALRATDFAPGARGHRSGGGRDGATARATMFFMSQVLGLRRSSRSGNRL